MSEEFEGLKKKIADLGGLKKGVKVEVADFSSFGEWCRMFPGEVKNVEVTLAPQYIATQRGRESWSGEKDILGAIVSLEPVPEWDLMETFGEVKNELKRFERQKLAVKLGGKVTEELVLRLADAVVARNEFLNLILKGGPR